MPCPIKRTGARTVIKLARFLRIAFALYRGGGAWAGDLEWESSDAVSLRLFLSGNAGQRLKARLSNASIKMNASAVQSPDPWSAGRAAGYMLALEDLSALAAPQVSEQDEEEGHGAGIPLEQIAP